MNLQIGWHLVSANREQLACFWTGKFWSWQSNGSIEVSTPWNIKPLGFIGNSPLPFELKAGAKYDTQKPDGSPGPVVTTRKYHLNVGLTYFIPMVADADDSERSWFVTVHGQLIRFFADDGLRIVSEHVEPPKPTAIERLEKLSASLHLLDKNELDRIIADLKAGAP